jgi:ABC-type multidrug transport system fused ATPase/permease subunit
VNGGWDCPAGKSSGLPPLQKPTNERFVYQDDDIIDKPFNWTKFKRLLVYMKPYARRILPIILVMMSLGTITKLTVPYLISLAIDRAIAPAWPALPSIKLLLLITGVVLVLYMIQWARALLANPRILILDEGTASIDTETELEIQEALKVLLEGRTSFMVAHRLSTIRNADHIVVLDHGEIK